MEVFYVLNHWHWWALAALLVTAELLSPSGWFLALAVAALLTGIAVRVLPGLEGLWQLSIFAVLAAISVPLALSKLRKRRNTTGKPAP